MRTVDEVSSTVPAVLAAAGGVGLAHSILPDHWVPLAVVARARRDPLRRVARLSLAAGLAHVLVSLTLGAVVIAIGLSVRSAIESRADLLVGSVLILTGAAFLLVQATGHGHHHHDEDDHDLNLDDGDGDGEHHGLKMPTGLSLVVPFGAAASPDLTILPVFLAASTLGTGAAIGSLAVFAAVTLLTFIGLTTLAVAGGYQLSSPWLDRYTNLITGLVLIVIGSLIATHLL